MSTRPKNKLAEIPVFRNRNTATTQALENTAKTGFRKRSKRFNAVAEFTDSPRCLLVYSICSCCKLLNVSKVCVKTNQYVVFTWSGQRAKWSLGLSTAASPILVYSWQRLTTAFIHRVQLPLLVTRRSTGRPCLWCELTSSVDFLEVGWHSAQ